MPGPSRRATSGPGEPPGPASPGTPVRFPGEPECLTGAPECPPIGLSAVPRKRRPILVTSDSAVRHLPRSKAAREPHL